MPVRMTGMISGMDTESLIKGMVDAQRMKNKRVEDKSTLLEWKQDKWKELNKKLYKLYTDDLSKMRLQGNYKAKKVSSSNENLVTVTGGVNAPEGSHKLEIKQLASSQYVTSGEIKTDKNDNATTLSTKLKDLGVNAGTLINFSTSGKTKTLEVTETTTIEDFVSTAKNVGLNANFDINQGRFFISSKNSGKANEFDITATTSTATAPKNEIKDLIGYSTLSSADKAKADSAFAILGNETSTADEVNSATDTLATLARYKIVDGQIRGEITQTAIDDEEAAIKAEVMQKEIELIKEKARQEGILTKEEIENINENTVNDTEKAINTINELKNRKIKVYLDDFGKGYSSLNYLKHLPIDYLKIDKSFIDGINVNRIDEEIISNIIYICSLLGIKVISEGIETLEQLDFIKAKSCFGYQGYLLSKPMLIEDLNI